MLPRDEQRRKLYALRFDSAEKARAAVRTGKVYASSSFMGRAGIATSVSLGHVIADFRVLANLCFLPIAHPPTVNAAMLELYPSIAQCAIVATALKVLLFPA